MVEYYKTLEVTLVAKVFAKAWKGKMGTRKNCLCMSSFMLYRSVLVLTDKHPLCEYVVVPMEGLSDLITQGVI